MIPTWLRIVIAAQVAVPTVALALSPAPFGFQMYAGTGWTHVELTHDDGSTVEIMPTDFVANYRGEIDWTQGLPEHICDVAEDVVRVAVTRWREKRTYTCP